MAVQKTFYTCGVCADIHYGMNPPAECPTCKAKNAYKPVSSFEAKKAMGL